MTDELYSAPRADEGEEPASCYPFPANLLRVYMSGATAALRPTNPETNPEYIQQSDIEVLDGDARAMGSWLSGYFGTPGFTALHGVGTWRGTQEVARVIEVSIADRSINKKDLEAMRVIALRLGYTVYVTIQAITAAEVF